MSNLEKRLLIKSLDSIWGVCDAATDAMLAQFDRNDGRCEQAAKALSEAQDAITDLKESLGVE